MSRFSNTSSKKRQGTTIRRADTVVLGAGGANLNGDDDVDATLTGVELATLSGSDGADVPRAQGTSPRAPRRRWG